jgi:hypothetical protein
VKSSPFCFSKLHFVGAEAKPTINEAQQHNYSHTAKRLAAITLQAFCIKKTLFV